MHTERSEGLWPVSGIGWSRPHSASRRTASPTAAPGPVQGSSAQPPASGQFWGLVDVPKARIPPWPRLETGPTQDWTCPLCAQQPGFVLALRKIGRAHV